MQYIVHAAFGNFVRERRKDSFVREVLGSEGQFPSSSGIKAALGGRAGGEGGVCVAGESYF